MKGRPNNILPQVDICYDASKKGAFSIVERKALDSFAVVSDGNGPSFETMFQEICICDK